MAATANSNADTMPEPVPSAGALIDDSEMQLEYVLSLLRAGDLLADDASAHLSGIKEHNQQIKDVRAKLCDLSCLLILAIEKVETAVQLTSAAAKAAWRADRQETVQ